MLWAEWLVAEVLAPVSHHPWVFTVPKRLRLFVLYDRRLLGALWHCAWETVRELHGAGLEDRHAVPGMVVSIQTLLKLLCKAMYPYATGTRCCEATKLT